MLQYLRDAWAGGGEACHIEELVSDVFVDFAPYAGADQQRLSFTRQHGRLAASSLTIEDNGDWLVGCTHVHAGSMLFSSAGLLQPQLAVRVPLVTALQQVWQQRRRRPCRVDGECDDAHARPRRLASHATTAVATAMTHAPPTPRRSDSDNDNNNNKQHDTTPAQGNVHATSLQRFALCGRGGYLLHGLPHLAAAAATVDGDADSSSSRARGVVGQLELDAQLPTWWAGRRSVGVRCGPLALRWSSTPHAEEWPVGARNAGDDDDNATMTQTRTRWHMQHTLDAAVRVPVVASAPVPVALTLGMQQPMPYGDALLGMALHTSTTDAEDEQQQQRDDSGHDTAAATTVRRRVARYTAASDDDDDTDEAVAALSPRPPRYALRLLVVQTLSSRTLSALSPSSPAVLAMRALDDDSNDDDATHRNGGVGGRGTYVSTSQLRSRIVGVDKPWHALPTLLGLHVSCLHDLVRVSTAAIFHDSAADLEAAVRVDATPLLPHTPTLLRLGWSSSRRLALGVTSLVGRVLSVTLGVHYMPGERVRFGLEFRA